MILSEACEKFLSHCRSAVSLSQHTLRAYGGTFEILKSMSDVEKDFPTWAKKISVSTFVI